MELPLGRGLVCRRRDRRNSLPAAEGRSALMGAEPTLAISRAPRPDQPTVVTTVSGVALLRQPLQNICTGSPHQYPEGGSPLTPSLEKR